MQGSQQAQGGKWYFYNLNAKSFGQPEFRMKWGDRKLEDNWRRSNKQTVSSLMSGSGAASDTTNGNGKGKLLDNKSREYYLANIPMTDSAMEVSNERLEEALFNMGRIYKNDLLDYQEAINAFVELLERYPDGEYTPLAYYYLYELYNSIQNSARANYFKSALSREYPDSHYSKLLTNPDYIKELEIQEAAVFREYESLFDLYKSERFADVITGVDSALIRFEGDPLVPKFKYLKALSTGALEGKEAMKQELDSLISMHPGTEESDQAQEIIDYMYVAFPVIKEADEAKEAEEIYYYAPESRHLFVLALSNKEDINRVNFDLLNFNLDFFNQYNLEIEKVEFNARQNFLVVRSFNNREGAERYLDRVIVNQDLITKDLDQNNYDLFIVSVENYEVLKEQNELNPYLLFYEKYYMEVISE
jgi:hypothetical protein